MAEVTASTLVPFGNSANTSLALTLISIDGDIAEVELVSPYLDQTRYFSLNGVVHGLTKTIQTISETLIYQGTDVLPLTRKADKVNSVIGEGSAYDLDGAIVRGGTYNPTITADGYNCMLGGKGFSKVLVQYQSSINKFKVILSPTDDITYVGAALTHPVSNQKSYAFLPINTTRSSGDISIDVPTAVAELSVPSYWWLYIPRVDINPEGLEFRSTVRVYLSPSQNCVVSIAGNGNINTPKNCWDSTILSYDLVGRVQYNVPWSYPVPTGKETVIEVLTFSNAYYSTTTKPIHGLLTILSVGSFTSSGGSVESAYIQVPTSSPTPLYDFDPKTNGVTLYTGKKAVFNGGRIVTLALGGRLAAGSGSVLVQYETAYRDYPYESNIKPASTEFLPALVNINATGEPSLGLVVNPPSKRNP